MNLPFNFAGGAFAIVLLILFMLANAFLKGGFIVLLPIVLIFGPLAFLLMIGMLVLFFYLLFWDYILVVENENLLDVAKISLNLIHNNLGKVLSFILPIVIITATFAIIVNAIIANSTTIALIAIVIYAYFGTAVIFTMMSFYLESLRYKEW